MTSSFQQMRITEKLKQTRINENYSENVISKNCIKIATSKKLHMVCTVNTYRIQVRRLISRGGFWNCEGRDENFPLPGH